MATQLTSTFSALEDQLVARATAPSSVVYSLNGSALSVTLDTAANILAQSQICENWVITFPSTLADLNVYSVTSNATIRCSLTCFKQNPYVYSDNFDPLITSGALLALLKKLDGTEIPCVGFF